MDPQVETGEGAGGLAVPAEHYLAFLHLPVVAVAVLLGTGPVHAGPVVAVELHCTARLSKYGALRPAAGIRSIPETHD